MRSIRHLFSRALPEKYEELVGKYEELNTRFRRLEKEHKKLQIEHSRMLFDANAVIEHEVEVRCKKEKEDGMKKLAELLREYNMSNKSPYILGDADYYVDGGLYAPQIISKSYGFIKRLVENEKIDFSNLKIDELTSGTDLFYSFSKAEVLLMLLAIQDEPIKFLIGILK